MVTQAQATDPLYLNIILRGNQEGSATVRVGDVARADVGLKQYIVDTKLNNARNVHRGLPPARRNGLTVSSDAQSPRRDEVADT